MFFETSRVLRKKRQWTTKRTAENIEEVEQINPLGD
jgi:hypothetical protein